MPLYSHHELVNRILESQLFSNKQVLKKLLRYLVEKFEKGEDVREIDIAIDVFNRKDSFDASDDTIVRVNMYKLRTALQRYALDEGKDEAYFPDIPKGSYSLQFVNRKEINCNNSKKLNITSIILGTLLIIVSAAFIGYYALQKTDNRQTLTDHPVWKDYGNDQLPVCITLADPFFFRATNKQTGHDLIVRDININSPGDLDSTDMPGLCRNDYQIEPLEYSYFSQNNIWPLLDLLHFFSNSDKELLLMPLSTLTLDEMKRNHHIVIGNINSFGAFAHYLNKTSIRVTTNPRRIIVHNNTDSLSFNINEHVSGYYKDYAFMVKLPGSDQNIISLIGDFHASGNKGLLHMLSDQTLFDKLKQEVEQKYGYFPTCFEIVVEVTSYNYVDFDTKLVYFNSIKANGLQ